MEAARLLLDCKADAGAALDAWRLFIDLHQREWCAPPLRSGALPLGEVAQARVNVMRETEDGFRIAEEDLKLRGEGEIMGTRQSGTPGFRLADLSVHANLLPIAREAATKALRDHPGLEGAGAEALRTLLYLFEREEAVRLLRAG